jgi:hypothetical protein
MHAELIGVKRFVGDVGDEAVGVARIVFVVVVAQGEISELHRVPPGILLGRAGCAPIVVSLILHLQQLKMQGLALQ